MIRKHFAGFAASALALAVSAQVFAGTVTTDGADIVVKTKGGLEVATADKEFSFKLGGRLQADYSTFSGMYTKDGRNGDAGYFRRAFLELNGVMYRDWAYRLEYDLSHNAGGQNRTNDGYWEEASMSYNGFKPLAIKFGMFDPDFGLEKATSSKWVTANERSVGYDLMEWAYKHDGGMGVQLAGNLGSMFYVDGSVIGKQVASTTTNGVLDPEGHTNGQSVKQTNLRAVFAPLHETGNVLHFAADWAQRDASMANYDGRFRTRLGMRGVNTDGGTDAGNNGNRPSIGFSGTGVKKNDWDKDTAWGLEGAWAFNAFSLQGEYLSRTLTADKAAHDIKATGGYVQAAYTITGEAREYSIGKFDKIKPTNKQLGAWEVFYRFDDMKVDDGGIATAKNGGLSSGLVRDGGEVTYKVHNLGVNWYANEAVKISAMATKARADGVTNSAGDNNGNGLLARVQYVF